jgi:phage regulator Rha-like protein
MNRTINDVTVKVFHYHDLHSLKANVLAFVTAYNFAKLFERRHADVLRAIDEILHSADLRTGIRGAST